MKGKGNRMLLWEGEGSWSPPRCGGTGAGQGQLPDRTWRGSAGGISSGEASSGSSAFLARFPLGALHLPELSQEAVSGAGWAALRPHAEEGAGRSQSQPAPAFPAAPPEPPVRPPHGARVLHSIPSFWLSQSSPSLRDGGEPTARSLRSRAESRNAGRRARSDNREWLFGRAIVGGAEVTRIHCGTQIT